MSMRSADFLAEFQEEHFPQSAGPWLEFDSHDPPWTLGQLRQMQRQSLIELDEPGARYRLTLKATQKAELAGVLA